MTKRAETHIWCVHAKLKREAWTQNKDYATLGRWEEKLKLKLNTIGGYNDKSESTNNVEEYNLETGTWESMPPLPQHLRGMNVALLNESIYVLGGYVHNAAAPLVTVFDNNDNLLKPRFEANVTVFEDKIYVFGGFSAAGSPLANCECYDAVSNTWTQCADMLEPRVRINYYALPFPVDNSKGANLCVWRYKSFGGVCVQSYDPFENVWTKISPMNIERSNKCGLYLNDRILAIGGLANSKDN
ncbi:kelch-like protein 5 [Zeugodacus cucurbitae]|uniref:kelch-like protein 5 n=1 Tax=Zeugodacus cucurbitae TaxID=28588 RepID=UPI0023D8FCFF|nr:kelch-like protein 5 [Zeugodacus cucurbitae]